MGLGGIGQEHAVSTHIVDVIIIHNLHTILNNDFIFVVYVCYLSPILYNHS